MSFASSIGKFQNLRKWKCRTRENPILYKNKIIYMMKRKKSF